MTNFHNGINKSIKFIMVLIISSLCVLLFEHYFQIEKEQELLSDQLKIYIFLDKNLTNQNLQEQTLALIENIPLSIIEYVSSDEVFKRAVQKNPFLAEVVDANVANDFAPYVSAYPFEKPNEAYIESIKASLDEIDGVDEVVFDNALFNQYLKVLKDTQYYKVAAYLLAAIVTLFFIVNFLLSFIGREELWKGFLISFSIYLVAGIVGFWSVWGVCALLNYPMPIYQSELLFVIPFSAFLGIILKD